MLLDRRDASGFEWHGCDVMVADWVSVADDGRTVFVASWSFVGDEVVTDQFGEHDHGRMVSCNGVLTSSCSDRVGRLGVCAIALAQINDAPR